MLSMGIDIGGSGFRMGVFDTRTGALQGEFRQHRYQAPITPHSLLGRLRQSLEEENWSGPLGIGFPGAVEAGRILTAPNLGAEWIGVDFFEELKSHHHGGFAIMNDADAVGLAEYRMGAGRGEAGTLLTITIGTGIGTTIHHNGTMTPNLEYGRNPHPRLEGCLEQHISAAARSRHQWSLEQWAERFQEGLVYFENLLNPDSIILYGGIMEHWSDISPHLATSVPLKPARFTETAGALGAALGAIEE
ncbi:MAG: ROK family protein [Candidatus Poseidonia sp.]|nr:ROK family protein [Poseidonia sp.]